MTDNRWEAFSDGELETIAKALNERAFNFLENYRPLISEIQYEQTRRREESNRQTIRGELMNKVRMKVTITGYYEADPAHYGDKKDNPAAMARVDEAYFQGDGLSAYESLESGFTITVEPA